MEVNEIQIIRCKCECGQRYDLHVYGDGSVERSMPIHCHGCHQRTYEHQIFLCDECYLRADLKGLGQVLAYRLDGDDDTEPTIQRDVCLDQEENETAKA